MLVSFEACDGAYMSGEVCVCVCVFFPHTHWVVVNGSHRVNIQKGRKSQSVFAPAFNNTVGTVPGNIQQY